MMRQSTLRCHPCVVAASHPGCGRVPGIALRTAAALLWAALWLGCGGGEWQPTGVEVELEDGSELEFAAELVSFDNDRGESLVGVMIRPDRGEPMPAVVLLHGAGGLFTSPDANDVKLEVTTQFADWAALLTRSGYAVLMPSSYYSRGYFEWNDRPDGLDEVDRLIFRVYDAYAALRYACAQPFIDCTRVGLIGFSNGASVAALALHEALDELPGMDSLTPAPERDRFASTFSYYPGCGFQGFLAETLDDPDQFYFPTSPIQVYHGTEDPLYAECQLRLEQVSALLERRGLVESPMSLLVYEGAGHGFDSSPNNAAEEQARDQARTLTMDGLARTLAP